MGKFRKYTLRSDSTIEQLIANLELFENADTEHFLDSCDFEEFSSRRKWLQTKVGAHTKKGRFGYVYGTRIFEFLDGIVDERVGSYSSWKDSGYDASVFFKAFPKIKECSQIGLEHVRKVEVACEIFGAQTRDEFEITDKHLQNVRQYRTRYVAEKYARPFLDRYSQAMDEDIGEENKWIEFGSGLAAAVNMLQKTLGRTDDERIGSLDADWATTMFLAFMDDGFVSLWRSAPVLELEKYSFDLISNACKLLGYSTTPGKGNQFPPEQCKSWLLPIARKFGRAYMVAIRFTPFISHELLDELERVTVRPEV